MTRKPRPKTDNHPARRASAATLQMDEELLHGPHRQQQQHVVVVGGGIDVPFMHGGGDGVVRGATAATAFRPIPDALDNSSSNGSPLLMHQQQVTAGMMMRQKAAPPQRGWPTAAGHPEAISGVPGGKSGSGGLFYVASGDVSPHHHHHHHQHSAAGAAAVSSSGTRVNAPNQPLGPSSGWSATLQTRRQTQTPPVSTWLEKLVPQKSSRSPDSSTSGSFTHHNSTDALLRHAALTPPSASFASPSLSDGWSATAQHHLYDPSPANAAATGHHPHHPRQVHTASRSTELTSPSAVTSVKKQHLLRILVADEEDEEMREEEEEHGNAAGAVGREEGDLDQQHTREQHQVLPGARHFPPQQIHRSAFTPVPPSPSPYASLFAPKDAVSSPSPVGSQRRSTLIPYLMGLLTADEEEEEED